MYFNRKHRHIKWIIFILIFILFYSGIDAITYRKKFLLKKGEMIFEASFPEIVEKGKEEKCTIKLLLNNNGFTHSYCVVGVNDQLMDISDKIKISKRYYGKLKGYYWIDHKEKDKYAFEDLGTGNLIGDIFKKIYMTIGGTLDSWINEYSILRLQRPKWIGQYRIKEKFVRWKDGLGYDGIEWTFPIRCYNDGNILIYTNSKILGELDSTIFELALKITVQPPILKARLKWKYKTKGSMASCPAIGLDGIIYFGSGEYFSAFSPNGTLIWKFKPEYKYITPSYSSPAIKDDGSICFGANNIFYVLNPNGTLRWKHKTGKGNLTSPAIGKDGTIYFGSWDKHLYAVNSDGILKWRYETGKEIWSSPAIGSEGVIYFGSFDGYLYALNLDGTLKWRFKTRYGIRSSPAIGSDGTIYLSGFDSYFYALNPDGTLKWKFKTRSSIFPSPAIGKDGTIYFGSWDKCFYAIYPDGTLRWKYLTGGGILSSAALDSGRNIYFGSEDSCFYALNPNGTLKWKFKYDKYSRSSPTIGLDGTIYFGGNQGYLYAIEGSFPISNSVWPKFRKNLANSGH